MHLDLRQDALDVRPHGVPTDAEARGDGRACAALDQEGEDFELAPRKIAAFSPGLGS
jgi:hypothetical protein